MIDQPAYLTRWPASQQELEQLQTFNRKLARLPRLKLYSRWVLRCVQGLLRASQVGGAGLLRKQGLSVETRRIELDGVTVPVRIIRPPTPAKGVVLDIHGGAWVIGNAQMNDRFNSAMASECEVTVVSVDYRLAVSAPIEALIEDCLCAARWLLDGANGEFAHLPVTLVGESAGGHLAVATLLKLKSWPELFARVNGALLYYGVYDLTGTPSVRAAPSDTLLLDGPRMVEAMCALTPELTEEQRSAPPLSPLHGDFSGFPPALMFACELDPLLDDTALLAERWSQSAAVEMQLLPSAPHGVIHFPVALGSAVLAHARRWIAATNEAVQRPG
jgi:acetyl esterase/lipase